MRRFQCILFLLYAFLLTGCSIWLTPSRMFNVDKRTPLLPAEKCLELHEHIIAVDDELDLYVFANNAEVLMNPEPGQSVSSAKMNFSFRVLKDGTVYLPAIGQYHIAGKSISEAENDLRRQYERFVIHPFVIVEITNKRVFVYQGGRNSTGGSVELENPNSTLIEAISLAGGLGEGRAQKIFLIRKVNGTMNMYEIDLSKAENSELGNIVLQSGDIIYVAPQLFMSRRLLEEITPLLSITNTFLLIINLFK